jgi:outer membrane protein TolC
MTLRPDLLQAQITLQQQGIQLKFDHNQIYPQLNLTGSYGYNGAGTEYNDVFAQFRDQSSPFYSYGAEMTIPLANQSARNTLKSDKVTEKQDLLKLKQIEQNVLVEIDNAVKEAESDYESVGATKQARIYAEAALDAEQKTYAVGKATTFEVLTYQNNLTTARGQEIRALANYEEALSNLAQQEGSTLQQRNIDIVVK